MLIAALAAATQINFILKRATDIPQELGNDVPSKPLLFMKVCLVGTPPPPRDCAVAAWVRGQ